ncbi:hypothetical protein DIS24_g1766 [Lasiodiplodia hormozganensis]|uniref:Hydantoin utilization protein A n=1 Tax=Lasiodiplodia hormozganensis TaxID=869390 RepID=A0AA39Z3K4_9PEZI|nr:hypothetical protein DIS24_g1766 [Lasiodiplodia hormozganensis]
MYRIGVDVGGTNSDAAILDITAFDQPNRGVLASFKAATTPDITSGIERAVQNVLADSNVRKADVLSITIGTTHFINALVEADARRLSKVAAVRLCGPFTRQIPPFSDFPAGLRRVLDGGAYYLDGGLEIDGREIAPLDHEKIRKTTLEIVATGVRCVALVGVFAPLDHAGIHEETCKKIMLEAAPELTVVCSRDLGSTGILERENATILNAAILNTAKRTILGFKRAMARLGLSCPLYLSQNDGTLLEADAAADHPIKTFASGPTNSMTGAAFLAGLDKPKGVSPTGQKLDDGDQEEFQVLVVDIGGTTTDVCALLPSGFPRQAPGFVEVGGIRTAFSMPEVVSIGLGGGSKVEVQAETGDVTIGPGSVGHYLTTEALVFGGSTLTTTDIAVASGEAELGDRSLTGSVPPDVVSEARSKTKRMIEAVIERMRISAAPVHVLLVGGGSLLVSGSLKGVAKLTVPIHHGAANAVGAAIAKVSGEVDVIEILEYADEKVVVAAACQKAASQAAEKGADPKDVKIVEINKIPLQYTTNRAIRLQVRAVGKLAIPEAKARQRDLTTTKVSIQDGEDDELEGPKVSIPDALEPTTKPSLFIDIDTYRPNVENGGGNGLSAFPTGVKYDVPVIDGDAMGRAYPTMYHATLYINGHSITPCALGDARGNVSVIMHGVPNTISQAWYIGRAVHMARKLKSNHIDAIFAVNPGKLLFSGKIVDVRRDISGGYTMGSVLLAPNKDDPSVSATSQSPTSDRHMIIPFQNEYLYAAYTDSTGALDSAEVVCTVPDLISILGQDGEAIGSQDLRYGLVVSVIGMPSHPLWKTEQGLNVGGPPGFGLTIPFVGVGEYTDPRSVIEDFGNAS